MTVLGSVLGLFLLVLWVYCIVDVITADPSECRHLPKLLWLLVVVLLPDVGSVLWLLLGRPRGAARAGATARPAGQSGRTRLPGYGRPARPVTAPDDDDAFLRALRERAEDQRRKAREQQRRDKGEQQPGT